MTPQAFFELLWRQKPDHLYIQTWALQNKQSFYCLQTGKAARSTETYARAGYDAYCCVALSAKDHGPHARCPAIEAAAIAGLWSDRDMASPLRSQGKKLPATVEEADRILPELFPPSLTIHSGYGLQDWWLFREAWVFEDSGDRERAAQLVYDWQTILQFRAARNEWSYDRLADLARLLRVPGTFNFKDPANPRPVEALAFHPERIYNPSEIREYIDDIFRTEKQAAAEPPTSAATPATASAPHPAATTKPQPLKRGRPPLSGSEFQALAQLDANDPVFSITVNPDAQVPQDDLDLWLAQDPKFARTWRHDRPDLADQSISGYCLALANFAADIGLAPQQSCDLLVHWRRRMGRRIPKHTGFFRLTIAKAMHRSLEFHAPAKEPAKTDQDQESPKPAEPESVRDALNRRKKEPADDRPRFPLHPPDPLGLLSSVLGFEIKRIVRIEGEDSSYRLETPGKEVRIPSTRSLIDQNAFRGIVFSQIKHLVARFKPNDWESLVRIMAEAFENPPGNPENDFKESAITTIEEYLAQAVFITNLEGQTAETCRQPMIIDGHVAVHSRDFLAYLTAHGHRNASLQDATSMLEVASDRYMRIFKRGIQRGQGRWLLSPAQFPPETHAGDGETPTTEPAGDALPPAEHKGKTNGHASQTGAKPPSTT